MRVIGLALVMMTFLFISLPLPNASASSFPIVIGTTSGSGTGTSIAYNIPTGATKGDLFLLCITFDAGSILATTWPSGWNNAFPPTINTNVQIQCRWKTANLTEGGTVTVGVGGAGGTGGYVSYLISNVSATQSLTSGIPSTGTSANPDPPSVTGNPTDDRLYIALYAYVSVTNNAFPASYTTNQLNSPTAVARRISMASRDLNGGAEDPGTATLSGSSVWVAESLTVPPFHTAVSSIDYTPLWVMLGIFAFLVLVGLRLPFVHIFAGLLGVFLGYQLWTYLADLPLSSIFLGFSVILLFEGFIRRV